MAIQKKSLISTLKTAKKANVAKEEFAATTNDGGTTRKNKFTKKSAAQRLSRMGPPHP